MYDLVGHAGMVGNASRMDAYVAALRQVVKPGDVVVDIGTGTGILAMVACQLGARQVYAIETSPVIGLAKRMARANGFADKIQFIQSDSRHVTLPEPANVIVSDLRGVLPLFGTHLPSIIDARERLLAPNGLLIPRTDTVYVAAVEAEEHHRRYIDIWGENLYELDLSAAAPAAAQSMSKIDITPENLCTTAEAWTTLDYQRITSPHARGSAALRVPADRTAHGIALWFDSELAPSMGFSGAPGEPPLVYGRAFFPWPERVALRSGETVLIDIRAVFASEDYAWRWETSIQGVDGIAHTHFVQSSLGGGVLSIEALRSSASDFVPERTDEHGIDQTILAAIDGSTSLEAIARLLADRYPSHFKNGRDALTRVSRIAAGRQTGDS